MTADLADRQLALGDGDVEEAVRHAFIDDEPGRQRECFTRGGEPARLLDRNQAVLAAVQQQRSSRNTVSLRHDLRSSPRSSCSPVPCPKPRDAGGDGRITQDTSS
jgi:hypothetical protein